MTRLNQFSIVNTNVIGYYDEDYRFHFCILLIYDILDFLYRRTLANATF